MEEAGQPFQPPATVEDSMSETEGGPAAGADGAAATGDGHGGPGTARDHPAGADSGTSWEVPLPADEIGRHDDHHETAGGPADRSGVAAATLGDKLDTGRQAVRAAVNAASSWITGRAMRGDPPAAVPVPVTAPVPVAAMSASRDPDAGRPLWRDTYAPRQAPSSPAAPSATPAGPAPGFSGASQAATGASAAGAWTPPPGMPGPGTPAGGFPAAAAGWRNQQAGPKQKRDTARRNRRQARLTLTRVEPWSVMKFSFMASVVAFIILFVAIAVLYMVLDMLGVFTAVEHTVSTISSSQGSAGTNIARWLSASRILGYTGMLGALNIVLITALSTIGAVIYNLIARAVGGVEVTLRESE